MSSYFLPLAIREAVECHILMILGLKQKAGVKSLRICEGS